MHYGCQRGTRQTFVLGVLGLYVQIETGLDVVITYVTNLPSRKDLGANRPTRKGFKKTCG